MAMNKGNRSIARLTASLVMSVLLLMPVVSFCAIGAGTAPLIPVEEFFRQDKLVNMKISPNGEYLAATVALADRTDLIFLSRNEKGVALISQTGVKAKQHVSDFEWVNPTRVVFRISEQSGKLSTPVISSWTHGINADGTEHTRVEAAYMIDTLRHKESYVLVSDGRYVFYLNTYSGQLKYAEIEAPTSQPGEFITDNNGQVRFFKGLRKKDISSFFYEFDSKYRRWHLLDAEHKSGQEISVLGFSGDNADAYLLVEQPAGPSAVYVYNFSTKRRDFLYKDDNVDPESVYTSPLTNGVIALRFLDGKPRVHVLDSENAFAKDLEQIGKLLPDNDFYPTSYTTNGNLAVIYASSDRSAGEFFLYDKPAMTLTPIFQTSKILSQTGLSGMRPIKFNARDGLEIEGFLTIPKGSKTKNLPTVLLVHGGPFSVFDTWGFDQEVQLLASRGYAVLQVNFRGSGNYGRAFLEKGYQQWGRTMQDDLTDATRWAIADGVADAKRICIYGASYGGYAALMGAVREPDLYACAIGNVGVYDLKQLYKDDSKESWFLDKYLTNTMGNTNLEIISPTLRASEIRIPVLLGAGREDKTALPLHTERMRDAIVKVGGAVDMVIYEGEGHGNYLLKNQVDWASRVLDFLDKNIGKNIGPATASKQ